MEEKILQFRVRQDAPDPTLNSRNEMEEAAHGGLTRDLFIEMSWLWRTEAKESFFLRCCHKCEELSLSVMLALDDRHRELCTASFTMVCGSCGWKRKWYGFVLKNSNGIKSGGIGTAPIAFRESERRNDGSKVLQFRPRKKKSINNQW